MDETATSQLDGGPIEVIGRSLYHDFIARVDQGLDGGEQEGGGPGSDCALVVEIILGAMALLVVSTNPAAQVGTSCHGGVLVRSVTKSLHGGFHQPLRWGNVGESLGQVQCAIAIGHGGHLCEDGRAEVRKLADGLPFHGLSRPVFA